MVKEDELSLRRACAQYSPYQILEVDSLAQSLNIPIKRAYCIFRKWSKHGWYNYGTSLRCGWMEEKGLAAIRDSLSLP